MGQILLQIGAGITNWGKVYYKLGQVLQIGANYYKLGHNTDTVEMNFKENLTEVNMKSCWLAFYIFAFESKV